MNKQEIIQKIIELEKERENCDSKSRESEVIKEIKVLNPKQFNGSLVKYLNKKGEEKIGRLWHSYYGSFKVYGKDKYLFLWTGNYESVLLEQIQEWIEEDHSELEDEIYEINQEIYDLERKILNLEKKKKDLYKDVFPYVNPKDFQDTEEINRSTFSLGGEPVYISEAFCEITGERITS
jgi:tRNA/tmRNA/rRNA uracil-C5-methylase (TrmA/RlmC/RlmD family)